MPWPVRLTDADTGRIAELAASAALARPRLIIDPNRVAAVVGWRVFIRCRPVARLPVLEANCRAETTTEQRYKNHGQVDR